MGRLATYVIKEFLAPKLHDLNIKAFYEGRKAIQGFTPLEIPARH
jgi:hypothetical protein